jgi:hypothetical protein
MMTASHAGRPQVLPRPACTPAAIRAVLAANADSGVLRRYDDELDAAFEEAREHGDLTPLVQTVRRWWFEADAWRNPDAQREFLARIERYQQEGPPSPQDRITRQEIRTRYRVWDVYRWELDVPAEPQFASLGQDVQAALTAFMDAVVIVDPMEYQRWPDEPTNPPRPVRTLHFGPHNEGLVTFLVYPPDDLVLVVKIQWLGDWICRTAKPEDHHDQRWDVLSAIPIVAAVQSQSPDPASMLLFAYL